MHAAVFLDRDGVINDNRADYVKSWEEFVFLPNVFEPLRQLAQNGLLTIVITNQSAINRCLISRETVETIHRQMCEVVSRNGGRVDAVLTCPHRPDENCTCRKPRAGLLLQAAERCDLDLSRSYLVGDALSDIVAGLAVGCCPILVLTGRGKEELARLKVHGCDGYRVAADLKEATEWILDDHLGTSASDSLPKPTSFLPRALATLDRPSTAKRSMRENIDLETVSKVKRLAQVLVELGQEYEKQPKADTIHAIKQRIEELARLAKVLD